MKTEIERLLGIIRTEPHPIRRLDAITFLLWMAWKEGEKPDRTLLLEVIQVCETCHGWKRDRSAANR